MPGVLVVVLALGLAGCGGSNGTAGPAGSSSPAGAAGSSSPAGLLLSGPGIGITVVIPPGWHQVIDSADPGVPEMVTPASCAGSGEVGCARGLARLAALPASSAAAAAAAVQHAVDSGIGVRAGATLSAGPQQVAGRPGYLLRFRFFNASGTLSAGIAAVPAATATASPATGSTAAASSSGGSSSSQFEVVLVWVSGKAGAPSSTIISQIIGSAAPASHPS